MPDKSGGAAAQAAGSGAGADALRTGGAAAEPAGSVTAPFSHDDLATDFMTVAARLDRLLGERECLVAAGVSRHRHVVRIAAAVGRALVRIGRRRVLVVDGHAGDPSYGEACGLGDAPGVADILAGRVTVAEAIRWTPNGFGFLPAGRAAAAREHGGYADGATAGLVQALAAQADTVLFVAPPLGHSVAAQLVAAHASGVLLMVHAGIDRAPEVTACLAALAAIGVPVRGSVLVRRGRGP